MNREVNILLPDFNIQSWWGHTDKRWKQQTSSFKNGIISLKGGDLKNELSSFHNVEIFELNNFFKELFFETKKIVYVPNPYMDTDNQQVD